MLQKYDTCDFSRIIESNSRPYHDEPAELSMRSITAITASVDGIMLVADKEYVTIVRFTKSCKPLVGPGRFRLMATTTTAGDPTR
jgi:hypothetical protein